MKLMSLWTLALAAGLALAGFCAVATQNETWLLQTNLLSTAEEKSSNSLPNVLILGDSISLGYTSRVRRLLSEKANVSRPKCNCGPSQFYLKHMRAWVGTNHWDVIHVNFGIWDAHYLKGADDGLDLYWSASATNALSPIARGTAIRDLGFRIRTPASTYCKNLRTILAFLKSRSGKVIFALSTPMTIWMGDDRCGRLRVYNELAAGICAEMGVEVNDLYSVAERHLDCQTDGCHYNSQGYRYLADAVVSSIAHALGDRPAQ